MQKIVSITRQASRSEGPSLRVKADTERWAADATRRERTRGILLHFPRPYEGPLTAA